MRCVLILGVKAGNVTQTYTYQTCTGFEFEKALYVPYTKFSGVFITETAPAFKAGQVVSVRVMLDGIDIHEGLPDEAEITNNGKRWTIKVRSRGYTLLLAQNQPYPRINTNVTLRSVCQANLVCAKISYEDPTPVVGNIYINEGSTVWEAAVAYCIKAADRYPFIKGRNTVRMTYGTTTTIDYRHEQFISQMTALNSTAVLSDVYMKELGDTYPFEAHDPSAADMGIVRCRYYPLDMQWLYDAQAGLQFKLDHSNKAVRSCGITYPGWKREELMDTAAGGGDMSGKRINYIKILGLGRGIYTTVRAYDDRFGQKEEE